MSFQQRAQNYPPYPQHSYDEHAADDGLYYPHHPQQDNLYLSPDITASYSLGSKTSFTSELTDRTATDPESNTHLSSTAPLEKEPTFWTSLFPNSLACRLYLLSVLLETVVDLIIEADILVLLNRSIPSGQDEDLKVQRLPVYLVIFALAHLFQLLLAMDAVHGRNTLQFLFLTFFNALLLLYAVIQKDEILSAIPKTTTGISHIPVNALTTIIALVIAVAEVAYIALGWKIYKEFGWKVYKLLGADRMVKRMYMHFQIFICLIKFDVFFWVGFSVQWIFLVLKKNDAEYYITVAALPLSLLLLIEGHMAARHENKWLMISFMSGCVTACCYFVYKIYKIFRFRNDPDLKPVFKTLTVFSCLALVLLIITFISAIIVMRNFGAGLKFHMTKHKKGASIPSLGRSATVHQQRRHTSHFEMNANPHRMSID